MDAYTITLEDAPSDQEVEVVQAGLNAHNAARSGRESLRRLSAFVRNAGGQVAGGAVGWTWGQVADIRLLWVRDDLRGRGLGRRLMQTVEAEAVRRGCRVVVLDTYSFQAPEFYQKLGYETFGVIDGYPDRGRKFFVRKQLGS